MAAAALANPPFFCSDAGHVLAGPRLCITSKAKLHTHVTHDVPPLPRWERLSAVQRHRSAAAGAYRCWCSMHVTNRAEQQQELRSEPPIVDGNIRWQASHAEHMQIWHWQRGLAQDAKGWSMVTLMTPWQPTHLPQPQRYCQELEVAQQPRDWDACIHWHPGAARRACVVPGA